MSKDVNFEIQDGVKGKLTWHEVPLVDPALLKSDRFKKDMIKESLYNFDDDIKYILNVDYSPSDDREHYQKLARDNGLKISTGSDFHKIDGIHPEIGFVNYEM